MRLAPEYDVLLNRKLTSVERLEPARTKLKQSVQLMLDLQYSLDNASDRLTEEQLETIANHVSEIAYLIKLNHDTYLGLATPEVNA